MTVARRLIELPSSLPPRGLTRLEAARYVGLSPNKFDEAVDKRLMPRSKRFVGVKTWDRLALDAAYSALPTEDPSPPEGEGKGSWD